MSLATTVVGARHMLASTLMTCGQPSNTQARAADRGPPISPALLSKLALPDSELIALCDQEWADLVAPFSEFAEMVESVDTSICPAVELADLIESAPTSTIAIAIAEMAYCRAQMSLALGCTFSAQSAATATFDVSATAWANELAEFPVYARWLDSIDRLTCDRATLLHAIRSAPSQPIRQALRSMFHFRATLALSFQQAYF